MTSLGTASGLIILTTAEAYLEVSQTSTMKPFCENIWQLKAVNYFSKKTPSCALALSEQLEH